MPVPPATIGSLVFSILHASNSGKTVLVQMGLWQSQYMAPLTEATQSKQLASPSNYANLFGFFQQYAKAFQELAC